MAIREFPQTSYGSSQPTVEKTKETLVMGRAPTTSDITDIGRSFLNSATGDYYVLSAVTGAPASATWKKLEVTGGAGTFTTVTTTGAITAGTTVDATTVVTGGTGVTATTGDITADAGDIVATLGAVDAATTVTAGTGVTVTTGDVTVSTGNINLTLGSVTAGDALTATVGEITATAGYVIADTLSLITTGDSTTGFAGKTELTGVSDLTANGAGTFVIKSKSANNLDSTGFLKIWIGTTAYYIPVFSAVSP